MKYRTAALAVILIFILGTLFYGCSKSGSIETFKVDTSAVEGEGSVTLIPAQPENGYESGTEITIKALPQEGYEFKQWTGGVEGSEEETVLTVTSDMTIGAIFMESQEAVSVSPDEFIHAQGRLLVDGKGQEFLVKGIAFGNEVWGNPANPPKNHHTEESYRELSDAGFNSIRFYLNYGIFEDDFKPYEYKQSGWDWLDQNIAWAKKYDMHLILNMHYPQGGFQSQGDGMKLWTNRDNQLRLIALWKAIAERYKDEPVILAFDLVNEPVVAELGSEEETFNQWKDLAQEITSGIREVDSNHLIIVERLNASKNMSTGQSNWSANRNGDMNFFLLEDPNMAYEFHIYAPFEFTHQNASWVDGVKGKFTSYPDETSLQLNGSAKWEWFTNQNPTPSTSKSDWQYLEGVPFKVSKPEYMVGKVTLQARSVGENGTVWFDDLVIKEYDEKGEFVRVIKEFPFDSREEWYLWQAGSSKGTGGYDASAGHQGNGAMKISGTTDDANIGDSTWIQVKQGYSYEISGYVKTQDCSPSSEIRIRLDFYSGDSVSARNKEYLESEIQQYLKFGEKNQVPLYLGEFGSISDSFKEDRGGARWVADMLDILTENKINFNYHTYHEEAFGLYLNPPYVLPSNRNEELMEVFKEKLR